jgi:hypothetical protein
MPKTDITTPLRDLLATAEQEISKGEPTSYLLGYRDALKAAIELAVIMQWRIDLKAVESEENE